MTQASLAYRMHQPAIWDGQVPEKYLRLLPYIAGRRIVEIGAAEGVLALLIADRDPDARVTALERRPSRVASSVALQERWRALGRSVDGCRMVCGDIRDRFDLFDGVETLVAIRTIYHLREDIPRVFEAAASRGVKSIVLGGNPGRARRHATGKLPSDDALGPFNYYAGIDGMSEVLSVFGYCIGAVVTQGDPIVTGHR